MKTRIRADLSALADSVDQHRLTLIVAPGGSGKTTLARSWRSRLESSGRRVAWLSLTRLHADLRFFAEDLLESLRATTPDEDDLPQPTGESVERMLSSSIDLQPDRLAREMRRELRRFSTPLVLILDGFEQLPRSSPSFAFVDAVLRDEGCPVSLVLTSRGTRPDSTLRFMADGQLRLIEANDLNLRANQLRRILEDAGIASTEELLAMLLARTEGWAIAARLAVHALTSIPEAERNDFLRGEGTQRELFDYVAADLLGRASPEVVSILETSALLGPSQPGILASASGIDGGLERIREAEDEGLLNSENGLVGVHDLWAEWLGRRMRNRLDPQELLATHERAGRALENAGETERAVRQYVIAIKEPKVEERIIEILAAHADLWLSQGRRRSVQDALDAISPDRIERTPALSALQGLLLSGADPDRAITHLKRAATAYHDAGMTRAEFMCLHELAVVAINENRVAETWAIYRRVLSLRRVALDATLRAFVVMALGHGAMLAGRFRMSLRLHDVARTFDHHPRERGGIAIVQSAILVQAGEWDEATDRIDALLSRPEQRRHGLTYHALQVFKAWIDTARGGDPAEIRRRLEDADETFAETRHTMSRLRALYVKAHHEIHSGNESQAIRDFETAAALAARTEFWEAEAAISGALSRLLQRLGDGDRARRRAREALDSLCKPGAFSARRGRVLSWAPGIALACSVLADLGEQDTAHDFFQKYRNRLESAELPLSQHAVLVCIARVQFDCGETEAARRTLVEAFRIADKAGLVDFAPELDAELRVWAVRNARTNGVRGQSVDRLDPSPASSEELTIRLQSFGGLAVERAGHVVSRRVWRGATTRRLLSRLLVAEGRPVTRSQLEVDLWPDMSASRARNNLRVSLTRLRNVLDPRPRSAKSLLDLDGDLVAVSPECIRAWDVTRCREALEASVAATTARDEARAAEEARRIASMVHNKFIPEVYDDWVLDYRRSLDGQLVEQSRGLAEAWHDSGAHQTARRFARIALTRDAVDEASWAIVVLSYLDSGDQSNARRAYEEARLRIERELEREPGCALSALEPRLELVRNG